MLSNLLQCVTFLLDMKKFPTKVAGEGSVTLQGSRQVTEDIFISSAVRKQRKINPSVQLTFSFVLSSGPQSVGRYCTCSGWVFHHGQTILETGAQTNPQACFHHVSKLLSLPMKNSNSSPIYSTLQSNTILKLKLNLQL